MLCYSSSFFINEDISTTSCYATSKCYNLEIVIFWNGDTILEYKPGLTAGHSTEPFRERDSLVLLYGFVVG